MGIFGAIYSFLDMFLINFNSQSSGNATMHCTYIAMHQMVIFSCGINHESKRAFQFFKRLLLEMGQFYSELSPSQVCFAIFQRDGKALI
jgi:hypothetical protein